uniref:RNA helicase n=1 Tax=Wollemia nobilis TaxID=56998 RepID=A0A0C9S8H6_9CONI
MASVALPRNVLPFYCKNMHSLFGASLCTSRISGRFFIRVAHFHTTHCLGHPNKGPLTLASLGFKSESDQTRKVKTKTSRVREVIKVDDKYSPLSANSHPTSKAKTVKRKTNDDRKQNATDTEAFPFAAKRFSAFDLPTSLLERLKDEGLDVPTDVQVTAIPNILKGQDVAIQSYTGSGKTLAYLIPILSKVGPFKETHAENIKGSSKPGIEAVIVAPSRELAMQIVREAEKILGPSHKRVVQQLVGGANRTRQEETLKKNRPLIVVGTPGRISEISLAGKLHTHGCLFLVLDEVDELLSFNFRENMHRILEHVGRRRHAEEQEIQEKDPVTSDHIASPNNGAIKETSVSSLTKKNERIQRQTILVSATMPPSVLRAASSWGHKPLLVRANSVIDVESAHKMGVAVSGTAGSTIQGAVESLPPSLEHFYAISKLQHKVDTLRRCVHALDAKSVIVFMNHSTQLKDTVFKLEARGLSACSLHGGLSKLERTNRLVRFKKGEIRILVTNELAARGLDVMSCDLVVNIDLPTDSIHYAHRAGRTGRLGQKGTVLTICEQSEEFIVKKFQRQLGISINCCEFAGGHLNTSENK